MSSYTLLIHTHFLIVVYYNNIVFIVTSYKCDFENCKTSEIIDYDLIYA